MEQNARTKRKMQGRKGKCKDDTKSDSLDHCEQVELSKTCRHGEGGVKNPNDYAIVIYE